MDSEDEMILEAHESPTFTSRIFQRSVDTSLLELRLYESDERQCRWEETFFEPHDDQDPNAFSVTSTYRLMRFHDTMEGFHTGSLDLSGRFPRRYNSLRKRWDEYLEDMQTLAKHIDQPHVEDTTTTGHPTALAAFEDKWNTRGTMDNVQGYAELAKRVLSTMVQNPVPIFQKIALHDLPTEIILLILETAGEHGARNLGSTCRALRNLAIPYIYQTCRFRLSWKGDVLDELPSIMQKARCKIIDEIAIVNANMEMKRRLKNLTVSNSLADFLAHIVPEDQDVPILDEEYFQPIIDNLVALLSEAPGVQKLTFKSIPVTPALMTRITALQDLRHVHFQHCDPCYGWAAVERDQIPPSLLDIHLTLTLRLDPDPAYFHQWLFLTPFSNIESLSINGLQRSSPYELIPPVEYLVRLGRPTKTIKRLVITNASELDLSNFTVWMQVAELYNFQVQLTHLKLSHLACKVHWPR